VNEIAQVWYGVDLIVVGGQLRCHISRWSAVSHIVYVVSTW